MLRILSILPGLVGFICALILLGSIIGYSTEEDISDIPIVPCSNDDSIGCQVAMTKADIEVPNAFRLLDIDIGVDWNEPDRSWFAVINDYDIKCEPDDNSLTSCTESDFEKYIIAGGSQVDGEFNFKMEPENYRFITGGKDGSTISNQDINIKIEVHLNPLLEIILAAITLFLFIGATEMAFPIKKLFNKNKDKDKKVEEREYSIVE